MDEGVLTEHAAMDEGLLIDIELFSSSKEISLWIERVTFEECRCSTISAALTTWVAHLVTSCSQLNLLVCLCLVSEFLLKTKCMY